MHYDRDNAMTQLAKQINAECKKAIEQSSETNITKITTPVFTSFQQKAKAIGCTLSEVKYRMAVLNGIIKER